MEHGLVGVAVEEVGAARLGHLADPATRHPLLSFEALLAMVSCR